ncbi:MAG: hypothetical protein ABTQ32_38745, partial [Myxococcaceae bacterium]
KDTVTGEAPTAPSRSAGVGSNTESSFASDNSAPPTQGPVTAGSAPQAPPPTFPSLGGFAPAPARAGNASDFTNSTAQPGGASKSSGIANGPLDSRALSITSSSDARPQVGGGTRSIATGDEDEMDDLDVQRRKLQSLAEELKRKATELEKKAGQLK